MATATLTSSPPTLLPVPVPLPPPLSDVENKLKYFIQDRAIRVSEYFKDFDPLRSGYITKNQFRRCMDQNLGLTLTDEDYEVLSIKYGNNKGLINYPLFIETMQIPFNPNKIDGHPSKQIDKVQKSSASTLSSHDKEKTDQLLLICAEYYKSRGITVRSSYQDFDRHNMGYITLSQFHRNFPGPSELSDRDISLIAQRYYDPLIKLYNYFRFNQEVKDIWDKECTTVRFTLHQPSISKQKLPEIEEILQRIRDAVYKYGIRTTEFFVDHDKFQTGIITENQFICGLSLCISGQAHLTRDDIYCIVKHFSTPDGHVKYKDFCHMMENAYNEPNLEKTPTVTIYRPLKGHLQKQVNALSPNDEIELETTLMDLKNQVKKRQLLLYPYFYDFDRKKGYTRGVTKAQFERILCFFSLFVTPRGLKLIKEKFEYPLNGDINYSAFVQAIDDQYTGQVAETEVNVTDSNSDGISVVPSLLQEHVDVEELISRLQEYVLINRIRVCEYFQDFDPLRSGFISPNRFRQGLNALRCNNLTTAQVNALCDKYSQTKQNMSQAIAWKVFVEDIDKVFDKLPTSEPDCIKPNIVPVGAIDFAACANEHQKQLLKTVLNRMKDVVHQRRVHMKPCFQDFDRHNSGHVTCSQFCQCLSYLELPVTNEELEVLKLKFCNAKGINYLKFIEQLEPKEKYDNKYEEHISTVRADRHNTEIRSNNFDESINIEKLMNRLKAIVIRKRIRILEFMKDYDKLRSGHISVVSFHRALDLCGFGLNVSETKALSNWYRSVKDDNCVDYVSFNKDIESVFTVNELEKMPTIQVSQYIPPEDVDLNQLSLEDQRILENCINKLAKIVQVRCIQLITLFEDYDKIHTGYVSKGQFSRVLSQLDLSKYLSDIEFTVLCNKFGANIGGRIDVNYNAFCLVVEECTQNNVLC